MYYLKLLKQTSYMERKRNSNLMIMTASEMLPVGLIVPIVIDRFVISEAKVIESNIFESKLKIVLINDNPLIPNFDMFNNEALELREGVRLIKHTNIGKSEDMAEAFEPILKTSEIVDIRPCNIKIIRFLVSDMLDYEGLKNLQLNVRFKK